MKKYLYTVTLKYRYYTPTVVPVVAQSSDVAIERARIHVWKQNRWYKTKDLDVIALTKGEQEIAV